MKSLKETRARKKGIVSCSCTWLRKWPERSLVERRQATNPAGRGLRLTTLRELRPRTREVAQKGFFPHGSGAARGDEMDVPCPRCNSSGLQKVSLAYEEGLYQSDKRAQFRGVLIASGGPGVLVGTSQTTGTSRGAHRTKR